MANNTACSILEVKLSSNVQDLIKELAQKKGFKSYKVKAKDISTNGGNYLGVLQTVDIKNEDGNEEINLFVKYTTPNPNEDFYVSMTEAYRRESFVYSNLVKKYAQLQEEYNVPEEERYKFVKSYSGLNTEVIILQNLSKLGFETCHRRDVLSLKFAELTVAQLAKFHGLSFALQQKEPEYFEKNNNIINRKPVINFEYNEWQSFIDRAIDITIEGLECDAKVKVENIRPGFLEKYAKYWQGAEEEAVCLCHGDFRQNNVLVKTTNGVESEVFVIDYQFVSFNSPALDLIFFIFVGSDQEFRTSHMDHLKDLYYDSLEKFLRYFDMKAEDVYSRRRFEKEFKEKLDYGLLSVIVMMPLFFTSDDVVPDMKEKADSMKLSIDDGYKKRIREHVDFFIQNGYL